MQDSQPESAGDEQRERYALLGQLQEWLEVPMLVLAFVWLALFVVEVVQGLSPLLERLGYVIWAVFVLQFALELTLAPRKVRYIRRNWLTAVALFVPALRTFRMLRLVRLARLSRTAGVIRGARLVRVLSSLNRGMRALRASMSRRGFGYVVLLTLIVVVAGAAAMYAFEGQAAFDSYASALWWTAMLITTIGSEYWPQSPEGRLLCVFLSLYGLAVFGYVTATLATFFIGRDAENEAAELASAKSVAELRVEIERLREQLRNFG